MRPHHILRPLVAGLVVGSALLTPLPQPLAPPSVYADGPGDLPMFRHDPAHTGYNSTETQLQPPLRLKWSYTSGASITSSPAVASGMVYIGSWFMEANGDSDNRKVYAFESQSPPVSEVAETLQPGVSFRLAWAVPSTWTGIAVSSYDV